jgi:hypothetical protein
MPKAEIGIMGEIAVLMNAMAVVNEVLNTADMVRP